MPEGHSAAPRLDYLQVCRVPFTTVFRVHTAIGGNLRSFLLLLFLLDKQLLLLLLQIALLPLQLIILRSMIILRNRLLQELIFLFLLLLLLRLFLLLSQSLLLFSGFPLDFFFMLDASVNHNVVIPGSGIRV